VVAVQVREDDEVDPSRIDAQALQRLQDGRPAVDEERALRRLHQIGAVQPSARTEGVTAAEDC